MRRASLAASLAMAIAWGCTEPREPEVIRPFGAPAPGAFFLADHRDSREVFRWTFAPADESGWVTGDEAEMEWRNGVPWIHAAPYPSLERETALAADEIDEILIRIEGLRRGKAKLFWAGPDESFSRERLLVLSPADGRDGRFVFRVGRHPHWEGPVARIRLVPTTAPGERVGLGAIEGRRYEGALRESAFASPWRIRFGDETRSAALLSRERPLSLRVEGPGEVSLHFGAGVLETSPSGETTSRVSVAEIVAGGRREISAAEISASRWRDVRVDAGRLAKDPAHLEIRLEGDDALVAISSLEIRPARPRRKPNVVLVSIDTLRADRMSLYGNPRETTPLIDRWARKHGVVFEQAVAPATRTLPSHVSMLTGLDATTHGVNQMSPAPDGLRLLPEILHEAGYFTAAVTGGGFVGPSFGFFQGFDVFRSWEVPTPEAPNEVVAGADRALELLEAAGDRPFFLFFHTYEVHTPFYGREPFHSRFRGEPAPPGAYGFTRMLPRTADDAFATRQEIRFATPGAPVRTLAAGGREEIFAFYDSGLAFADAQVGRILAALERRGLLDSTLVVLTSDHGENLGEDGLGGHGYLTEENLLVPLVLSYPARLPGGSRVEAQVRVTDIVPTVLDLLGLPSLDGLDGTSLLAAVTGTAEERPRDAVTYASSSNWGLSLRTGGGWKYVYNDTLWRSGPTGTLETLGKRAGVAPSEASLRAHVERTLEARNGLHLLIRNDKSNPDDLVVDLENPNLTIANVKATRLDCNCVSRTASGAGLRVAPGREIRLQIDDPTPERLVVDLESGSTRHRAELDVAPGAPPAAIGLAGSRWRPIDPATERLGSGVASWWQGPVATASGDAPGDEVLGRLRALGYLQ